MNIGILQCGHAADELRPTHGDYGQMFERLLGGNGFGFKTFNVVDMEFPASVHDCDGWLLTGSRHGVYDGLPFIAPLEDFVRRAYAEAVPLVGVCFGHQLIAQALGGRVEKFAGGWSVGRQSYAFDGLGEVALNAWHQDQVVTPPPDAQRVAGGEFCENAAFVYGDRAFTVQAHPEFSPPLIADMVRLRRGTGTFPSDRMDEAAARVGEAVDNPILAHQIAAFFQRPRGASHG